MSYQKVTASTPGAGLQSADGERERIVGLARDGDDPKRAREANMEHLSPPAPFKLTNENEKDDLGREMIFKQLDNESDVELKDSQSNPAAITEGSPPSEGETMQGASPGEEATPNSPRQHLADAHHQWDQYPFDTGTHSVFPSPSPSPPRPLSPGAYRVRPGRASQRAASSDSTTNVIANNVPARDSDTPMVEASLVVDDEVRHPVLDPME
jgi:hypothetical protein